MTTALTKPVCRKSETTIRDGSKRRALVITIYPAGFLGLRPAGCRSKREETIDFESVYSMAVKQRVAAERTERMKNRKSNNRRTA